MNDKEWQQHMDSCISVIFWRNQDSEKWLFEGIYGVKRAQVFWHNVHQRTHSSVYLTHTGDETAPLLPYEIESQIASGVLGNSGTINREKTEEKLEKTANMCVRDGCKSPAFFCTQHVVEKLLEKMGK